ncbi:MAG: DUF4349 domain-containing protein [Chloroflexi bacterium]|nr:DUF4349 domain-containing protein [Chloroflexota bacterium]
MKATRIALLMVATAVLLLGSMTGCAFAPMAESESGGYWPGEDEEAESPMPEAPAMSKDAAMEMEEEDVERTAGESAGIDRMVVRNGSMELVVEDVSATSQAISQVAATFDGHVVSSSIFEKEGRTFGSIVIRVDGDRFDAALSAIRILAVEVLRETTSSRDVTEEYVDLSARKGNLERTEVQLLALMERAGTVEELLAVQREVSRVRGEIEQLEGRMRYLEQTSATSLIEVLLNEAVLSVSLTADGRVVEEGEAVSFESDVFGGFAPYTYDWDFGDGGTSNDSNPTHIYEDEGWYSVRLKVTDDRSATAIAYRDYYIEVRGVWSPGDVLRDAIDGLGSFGRWFLGLSIWLLVFTPLWAVPAGIAYLVYRLVRRRRRAKKV